MSAFLHDITPLVSSLPTRFIDDSMAFDAFARLLLRAETDDKSLRAQEDKFLFAHLSWARLERWMKMVDLDASRIKDLVEAHFQQASSPQELASKTRGAKYHHIFDPLPLCGLGLDRGHTHVSKGSGLSAGKALIKESISGEKENGGPCVLAVMIKAFLEALADMAQFESNDPFPQDTEGVAYISLSAIAPLARHRTDRLLATGRCPSSAGLVIPRATSSNMKGGDKLDIRKKLFQAFILHFSNVLNFDNRWNRQRMESESLIFDGLCKLMATKLNLPSTEITQDIAIRKATTGGDDGGGDNDSVILSMSKSEFSALESVNGMDSALETLEIKRNIMSGEGPFALSSGGRSSVQLLQLPMGRTKEQATSLAHMKELFYIGLNTLFLDTSNDPLHRVHQIMALLSHTAGDRDIWGPFLIICSRKDILTWERSAGFLCPGLKVMGYYGKEEDRANLRRCGFANPTNPLYCSRSPFHIFITHHEAFLEDQEYLESIYWQHMIINDDGLGLLADTKLRPLYKALLKVRCRRRMMVTSTLKDHLGEALCPLRPLIEFLLPSIYCALGKDWPSTSSSEDARDWPSYIHPLIRRLTTVYLEGIAGEVESWEDYDARVAALFEPVTPPGSKSDTKSRREWCSDALKEELKAFDWIKLIESKAKERGGLSNGHVQQQQNGEDRLPSVWMMQWEDLKRERFFAEIVSDGDTISSLVGAQLVSSPIKPVSAETKVDDIYSSTLSDFKAAGSAEAGIKMKKDDDDLAWKLDPPPSAPVKMEQGETTVKQEEEQDLSLLEMVKSMVAKQLEKRKEICKARKQQKEEPQEEAEVVDDDDDDSTKQLAGYARIVGKGIDYVMTQPQLSIGRAYIRWQLVAHGLGLSFKPGQGLLGVDLHVSDHPMVGCEHAVIRWKPGSVVGYTSQGGYWQITCPSKTGMLLNGSPINNQSGPLHLPSQSILTIGDSVLYFLNACSPKGGPEGPGPTPKVTKDPLIYSASQIVSRILIFLKEAWTFKKAAARFAPQPIIGGGGGGGGGIKRERSSPALGESGDDEDDGEGEEDEDEVPLPPATKRRMDSSSTRNGDENGGDAASHLSMLASYAAQGGGGGGDFRGMSPTAGFYHHPHLVQHPHLIRHPQAHMLPFMNFTAAAAAGQYAAAAQQAAALRAEHINQQQQQHALNYQRALQAQAAAFMARGRSPQTVGMHPGGNMYGLPPMQLPSAHHQGQGGGAAAAAYLQQAYQQRHQQQQQQQQQHASTNSSDVASTLASLAQRGERGGGSTEQAEP